MRNEWRSNIWMIIQLVIVSIILWYMFVGIWALVDMRMSYRGYDVSNLYFGEIKAVPEESGAYKPYDNDHSMITDFKLLLSKIRSNPNVEIADGGINAVTYIQSAYNTAIACDSIIYRGNMRIVTPDIIRLYRLESPDGLSTEQLAQMIERGEMIISRSDYGDNEEVEKFIDKDVYLYSDSSLVRHVGALAYGLRRLDYEPQWGTIYTPLPENSLPNQILIRVRPDSDKDFRESLRATNLRAGNVYVSGLQSVSAYRESAHLSDNIAMRNYLVCATFLLLVIFLGFLGTFWFRTQQRIDEIAVRIVNGATRSDIFRRFIGEGMLLLCIATIITLPIEIMIVHYDLISPFIKTYDYIKFTSIEIYQSFALVLVTLVLLIVAGIWFPARKGMNINPAYALKDL